MAARRALRLTALAAAAAGAFFLLAAGDLALRSRSALAEARRHAAWHADPAAKAAHFKALYAAASGTISRDAAQGHLTAEQAARAETLAAAERDMLIAESSAKQAVLWYRSAAEDFSSPLNPWSALAARELPAALEAWRAELEARGLKTEDWMLR